MKPPTTSERLASTAERWARRWIGEWRTLWKVLFATVALLDVLGCWPVFVEGWMTAARTSSSSTSIPIFTTKRGGDDDQCSTYPECFGQWIFVLDWMGPLFCVLCMLEAVMRAQEAREEMLENAALDNFERKLARLYSSARNLQAPELVEDHDDTHNTSYDEDDVLARRTLRFWTPVLFTLTAWGVLLPWTTLSQTHHCGPDVDSALATLWIQRSLQQMVQFCDYAMDELLALAWHTLLPFSFWQPHKIYMRILTLLRWVRYFRFAGPLLRMLLKVHDQFWVFLKTKKQSWQANAEKAKRVIHRSMLFEDIRKIESLTKLQMPGFARVPTRQIVAIANNQSDQHNIDIATKIKERKETTSKLKQKLNSLKNQIRRSSKIYPTSELYDRIRDLSQEFTHTVGSTLWTANLISPQTRFSVTWRIIVTCALVSELSRICTSYQLYGRVDVSYTAMMMSVLGCTPDRGGNILTATGRFTRKIVRKLVRLPQEQLLSTCTKSSIASHTLAHVLVLCSGAFETTIDLVCFVDIYVWFFTGELDPEGRVVPKPFFYRCILPGTLVQVLDHPTVPTALPNILFYTLSAANAVGYSRMIRWVTAVVPAINVFLVDPIKKYYFRPMEDDEWLRYTESLAIFPVFSGADIRYTMSMSHPNFNELDYTGTGSDSENNNGLNNNMRRRNSALANSSEAWSSTRRGSVGADLFTPMGNVSNRSQRRSSNASIHDDPLVLPSSTLGRRVAQRESNSKQLGKPSSFIPVPSPEGLSRRVSSSYGLNLDSQHVTWGEATTIRRPSGGLTQVDSQQALSMDDDVSMPFDQIMVPPKPAMRRRRTKRDSLMIEGTNQSAS